MNKMYVQNSIKQLANILPKPIYIVGGYVRNYLIDGTISDDIDLASPLTVQELLPYIKKLGFSVVAEYKKTNTIVFCADNVKYEYTTFRTDSYVGGEHTPSQVTYTDDIVLDAKRRDFKCNAIYYDIKKQQFVDVLGGIKDVENKILDTVVSADKVFKDDGLRIMRLCRLHGELGFNATEEVEKSAQRYCKNLCDISPERILVELKRLLVADTKWKFSPKDGHYKALKLMCKVGALKIILPELYAGKNMEQRADFHDHDVLEHSLRCALYADKSIRLPALLHDIGKPYAMQKDGKYHEHAKYGEEIACNVLNRLKASKNEILTTCELIKYHMLDVKLDARESKIRTFICKHNHIYNKMLLIKQADFSACKDNLSVAPTVIKWQKIYDKMLKEKVPFSLAELNINGTDLINLGFKGKQIGEVLNELWLMAILTPKINTNEKLIEIATKRLK